MKSKFGKGSEIEVMVKRDISSDLKEIVGQKLGDIPLVEEHEVLNENYIYIFIVMYRIHYNNFSLEFAEISSSRKC